MEQGRDVGVVPFDLPALRHSIVEDALEAIVVLTETADIAFVNPALGQVLGYEPQEVVGRSVIEFLHPDEIERAMVHIGGGPGSGENGVWEGQYGTSSFRLLHVDGTWVRVDVTGAAVTDGEQSGFAVYARPADYQHATDAVLVHLLAGASRADALAPVLDVFSWDLNGITVAITWTEGGKRRWVSTRPLPSELVGAAVGEDPWGLARATGRGVHLDTDDLAPTTAALAVATDVGRLWIEPVPDPGGEPALVTVWGRPGGRRPEGHAYGMGLATTYSSLILRWTHQQAALEMAASVDPLTGVSNRAALFAALEDDPGPGCLLFCDLDRFKPVNDDLGHLAGDEVLRQVAGRLAGAVGSGDLLARSGGDEFVVLLPGADRAVAEARATAVLEAMAAPFEVVGTSVHVGVTIGIAEAVDGLTEQTMAAADGALLTAKGAGRGQLRWSVG